MVRRRSHGQAARRDDPYYSSRGVDPYFRYPPGHGVPAYPTPPLGHYQRPPPDRRYYGDVRDQRRPPPDHQYYADDRDRRSPLPQRYYHDDDRYRQPEPAPYYSDDYNTDRRQFPTPSYYDDHDSGGQPSPSYHYYDEVDTGHRPQPVWPPPPVAPASYASFAPPTPYEHYFPPGPHVPWPPHQHTHDPATYYDDDYDDGSRSHEYGYEDHTRSCEDHCDDPPQYCEDYYGPPDDDYYPHPSHDEYYDDTRVYPRSSHHDETSVETRDRARNAPDARTTPISTDAPPVAMLTSQATLIDQDPTYFSAPTTCLRCQGYGHDITICPTPSSYFSDLDVQADDEPTPEISVDECDQIEDNVEVTMVTQVVPLVPAAPELPEPQIASRDVFPEEIPAETPPLQARSSSLLTDSELVELKDTTRYDFPEDCPEEFPLVGELQFTSLDAPELTERVVQSSDRFLIEPLPLQMLQFTVPVVIELVGSLVTFGFPEESPEERPPQAMLQLSSPIDLDLDLCLVVLGDDILREVIDDLRPSRKFPRMTDRMAEMVIAMHTGPRPCPLHRVTRDANHVHERRSYVSPYFLSDRDVLFAKYFWRPMWLLLDRRVTLMMTYRPPVDGWIEVHTFITIGFSAHFPTIEGRMIWEWIIPSLELVDYMFDLLQFDAMYGRIPCMPFDLAPVDHHTRALDEGIAFGEYVRNMHHDIHSRIILHSEKHEVAAELGRYSAHFTEVDLVMVRLRPERYSPRVATTKARSAGPFPVVRAIGEKAYVVGIPRDWGMSPTFSVNDLVWYHPTLENDSGLEPHILPGLSSAVIERSHPAPPVLSPLRHEHVELVLGEIINAAEDRVDRMLLVRWQDRPTIEDKWVLADDLRRLRPELIHRLDDNIGFNSSEPSSPHLGRMMEDHLSDQATAGDGPDGARALPRRSARVDDQDPSFKYTA